MQIAADGDNLIRRVRDPVGAMDTHAGLPDPDARKGAPVAELLAQGLPNLLHELVHVVLARRLDDDHGIDYQAIPFDLDSVGGRRVLWEELACCVLSCAYLSRRRTRDGIRESDAQMRARVDAWFAEQVDIQPVFYGMEDRPADFWNRVEAVARSHADEVAAITGLAYARVEAALRYGGASRELSVAPERLSLDYLLKRQGRAGIS